MLPSYAQWKGWSLPSKYGLIGLGLGIISLIVGVIPMTDWRGPQPNTPTDEFQDLIVEARNELRYATKCLSSYKLKYWENSAQICPPPELHNLQKLFAKYRGVLSSRGLGEIDRLDQIPSHIVDTAALISNVPSLRQMRLYDAANNEPLKRIWYEAHFLDWYLCWFDARFKKEQCKSAPDKPQDDTMIGPKWDDTIEFVDYLGYLD